MLKRVELAETRQDGVVVVRVAGRLDSGQIQVFEKYVAERIGRGHRRLVVDFEDLVFLASSAFRVLLVFRRKLDDADGVLVLCGLKPHIADLFRVGGFHKLLRIRETRHDAIREARPADGAAPAGEASGGSGRGAVAPARDEPASPAPAGGRAAAPAARPGFVWRVVTAPFRFVGAVWAFIKGR